jgi:hypothetical protein
MMMDLLTVLRKEESRLLAASGKIGAKLSQVRTAINAMPSNGHKPFVARARKQRGKARVQRGKKLSAAHRAAITAAWAKRRNLHTA